MSISACAQEATALSAQLNKYKLGRGNVQFHPQRRPGVAVLFHSRFLGFRASSQASCGAQGADHD